MLSCAITMAYCTARLNTTPTELEHGTKHNNADIIAIYLGVDTSHIFAQPITLDKININMALFSQ